MDKTVIVYASGRTQRLISRKVDAVLTTYRDSILAQVNAAQLEQLEAEGYTVEVLDTLDQIPVGGRQVSTSVETPATRGGLLGTDITRQVIETNDTPHHYLLQFIGPIKPEWLQAIERAGGVLREPLPSYAYVVELDNASYHTVSQLDFVRWIGYYEPALRVSPDVMRTFSQNGPDVVPRTVGPAGDPIVHAVSEPLVSTFSVHFFSPELLQASLPAIQALGGTVGELLYPQSTTTTVTFAPDTPDLQDKVIALANVHGVKAVDQFVLPQVRNNVAALLMRAADVMPPNPPGLTGKGEIVGVADTGLDSGDPASIHPDFAGRVVAIQSWPISDDYQSAVLNRGADDGPADVDSGHGTHVSGSIVGSGAASAQNAEVIQGLAPEAGLVFQAIEQKLDWTPAYRAAFRQRYGRDPSPFGLAGVPADLYTLFQKAYDAGVRIHNNSWGGGPFGAYNNYAEALDRFVWEHQDFVVLVAAGNDGSDADRDGTIDLGSVTPPATAKNCITVGAAESLRAQLGLQVPWSNVFPFPGGALGQDMPSDAADDLASFSSRGPTRDGRIKPDVVAPGTNIVSTRSHRLSDAATGWGPYPPLPQDYMVDGGTSMATPLTTGAVALIRQFLRASGRSNPSAAMLKALLLHGAQYMPYRFGLGNGRAPYDYEQGWGHVNVANCVRPLTHRTIRLYERTSGLTTGRSVRLSTRVADQTLALKVTLVWIDYPGTAGQVPNLVNDLDLIVQTPANETYNGNQFEPPYHKTFDRVNNVEMVLLREPAPGTYTITVRAHNVARGPQAFALVWSGPLE